jgi:hypothetical protein
MAYRIWQTDREARMSRMQVDTASRLHHMKGLYHRETERYELDGASTKKSGVLAFRQPDADDGN